MITKLLIALDTGMLLWLVNHHSPEGIMGLIIGILDYLLELAMGY